MVAWTTRAWDCQCERLLTPYVCMHQSVQPSLEEMFQGRGGLSTARALTIGFPHPKKQAAANIRWKNTPTTPFSSNVFLKIVFLSSSPPTHTHTVLKTTWQKYGKHWYKWYKWLQASPKARRRPRQDACSILRSLEVPVNWTLSRFRGELGVLNTCNFPYLWGFWQLNSWG